MTERKSKEGIIKRITLSSDLLNRIVEIDCYFPQLQNVQFAELLLINDGQDLRNMNFSEIADRFRHTHPDKKLIYAGIHCSADRKNEYGTAGLADYAGRGIRSGNYQECVIKEILPAIQKEFPRVHFKKRGFAGFSLGGLSAIDTTWNHPDIFSFCGVFSGALWWRDKDQNDESFDETKNRIIHNKILNDVYRPGLRFFFEAGKLDETADRNGNGIIDSIDDTLDLLQILKSKGYESPRDLHYLELEDGKHDITTWGRSFPVFLEWLLEN